MAATLPLYRYTITVTVGDPMIVDALGYDEAGPWTRFDDAHGTVLTRRTDTIIEVRRSDEPIGSQEVEEA